MWKKLIFSVVSFVLLLALAELAARQVEENVSEQADRADIPSGWQQGFFANVFDWHEPDPELLWRLKPDLNNQYIRTNSSHTIGPEVAIPKPANTWRILILGDSSPLGLGLKSYDHSFGVQLQRLLQDSLGSDRRIELVNASVAGYSSEQLRRYLAMHGEILEPDVVILYCGNNDASISGFCTDQELLETQRLKWLRQQLSCLALFRMVRAIVGGDRQATSYDGREFKVRVSPRRFGENLTQIAKQCRRLGCMLIVVKPPVPLMWPAGLQFKMFTTVKDSVGHLIVAPTLAASLNRPIRYCLERNRMPAWYGEPNRITRLIYASAYRDKLAPDSAVAYYRKKLKADPNSAISLNNLGVAHWERGEYDSADHCLRVARQAYVQESVAPSTEVSQALGSVFLFNIGINLLAAGLSSAPDTAEAMAHLDSALQADYLSLRVKRTYLNQIDSLGRQNPGVEVIDMPTIFTDNGGESLFIDHCHPTREGHRLIARELYETLVGR
ncbi:MAG: hypothetical protein OEV49_03515 [candidate division Zixibacteria bacterium]|nr:hypothetical protein [candidate division Zixibacteria bacterium]MDH3938373.1 hypothetical protein [candidate division Zixibacteria bacterium]MDH4033516.1 hypothetical protein [candidate division Zixibacteria bacterium]